MCRLAAERVPAEEAIAAGFQARNEAAEKAYQEGQEALTARYQEEKAAAEAEEAALRKEAMERFESEHATVLRQYEEARQDIAERFEAEKVAAEQEMQNAQWEATTIAEAARGGSGVQLKEIQAQLESRWQELQTIHRQAVELLESLGPVARLRRSAAGQHAAGAAPRAPLLPCLGHGPHPVPCPGQPVHAAAGSRLAADGHRPVAVGRHDRAGRGLFRMEQ